MVELHAKWRASVRASHAGLFICPGKGRHATFRLATWELIFVRSGRLALWEEDRQFTVERDQAVLLQPGLLHGGTGAYDPDVSFYWLHFHVDPRQMTQSYTLTLPQCVMPVRPDRMRELFHRFMQDHPQRQVDDPSADLLVLQLLVELGRPRSGRSPTAVGLIAQRALAFIDAHFHETMTAATVASALHKSSNYIGQAFRAATGMTVTDYLLKRRIQEARLLLVGGNDPVKQIARLCGFANEAYFSRVFRRFEGVSPSGFRTLHAAATINVH